MSFPAFNTDELAEVAERLRANGAQDVAVTIECCLEAWRRDQRLLATAQAENTAFQQQLTRLSRDNTRLTAIVDTVQQAVKVAA